MVIVTGANGLLGSFIVRQLITQGNPFIALKRKDSDTSLLDDVAHHITWKDVDVLDPVALHETFEEATHVIHSAAIVSFNPRHKKRIFQINVEGTKNVVDACLATNIKRLVHISSVAALGRQKDQRHIDENARWIDSPLNSAYAESKYQAELEVFRAHEEGLQIAVLNPSVILAPADWNKSSATLFRYAWHEHLFYINSLINYVDVRDVAKAAIELLHSSVDGERFIVSGGTLTNKELFEKMALRWNKKPPSIKVSKNILMAAARIEQFRSWLLTSEPLLTRETARIANTFFSYNNEKIIKTLEFRFQSIDETLQWCCDYYMTKFSTKK
ncbi:MAG: NAD-dependent epimerase/dehydratase family protein [Cyclobacteriaceae bacterium]|nr:NAD-dependent epimerase/dehydratase family protein [Cyclobacteriaceae bacterium]